MAFFGTTTPLAGAGTITLGPSNTDRADNVSGVVFANQAGNIFIEQSGDNTNWDISTTYPVVASTAKIFSEPLYLPYVRIRYVNGATPQTAFRLFARYTSAGAGT